MANDWQTLDTAPQNTSVLVCDVNCRVSVATLVEREGQNEKGKRIAVWKWKDEQAVVYRGFGPSDSFTECHPKMWRPLPEPPTILAQKKYAADLLQKQIEELRA